MSRFSLVSTRRTLLERAKVSGYGLDMRFSPSHCWKHERDILRNDKRLIVVQYIWDGPFRASAMGRRAKMAAVAAARDGSFFAVGQVARQYQARTTTSISLSKRQSSTGFGRWSRRAGEERRH